jgi:hypothetical protein
VEPVEQPATEQHCGVVGLLLPLGKKGGEELEMPLTCEEREAGCRYRHH